MRFDGLILDFDGVLVESEYVGNKQIADYLTGIGRALPEDFHVARRAEDERVLREGLEAVAGAVAFVETLPAEVPRAIASSSSMEWIQRHLDHLKLRHHFPLIFSGREHVERGKPEPDLYLHAAEAMGVAIDRVVIVEDSPVGVRGAVASGAFVIGLAAGSHCLGGHGERLKALGAHAIAESFDDVARLIA